MNFTNILLITDNSERKNAILSKLVLLRAQDSVLACAFKDYKKIVESHSPKIVIFDCADFEESSILKFIEYMNKLEVSSGIILLTEDKTSDFLLKTYDLGICDYISVDDEGWEILIKIVNCLKYQSLQRILARNNKYLYSFGILDYKTGLYKYNALSEMFQDLSEDKIFKDGVFCVVTLDEKIKTKVSTNRLALVIKNSIRNEDIGVVAKSGKFYIILPSIDLFGARAVISKIQDKMGMDFPIHSGLTKIGIQKFSEIEKNGLDSLESAIINNEICACLSENMISSAEASNSYYTGVQKQFKLFQTTYNRKLQNVIEPVFSEFKRSCNLKMAQGSVNYYSNKLESVFSLKNETVHSELTIRYDNYAKLKIDISHSGLDSPENTQLIIPLNKLSEKDLLKLLKKMLQEFKSVKNSKK